MGRRLLTRDGEVQELHHQLLERWNERDAAGYAELFAIDGSLVGFDGTGIETRDEIRAHLEGIFAGHRPARYVSIVREVRELGRQTTLLRAVAGMVPPGGTDLNPDVNAVQVLVAVVTGDGWRIAHFQTTPAAFHDRPEAVTALTEELRTSLA
jgi:uncharacterized protein (TIGR02246 family)